MSSRRVHLVLCFRLVLSKSPSFLSELVSWSSTCCLQVAGSLFFFLAELIRWFGYLQGFHVVARWSPGQLRVWYRSRVEFESFRAANITFPVVQVESESGAFFSRFGLNLGRFSLFRAQFRVGYGTPAAAGNFRFPAAGHRPGRDTDSEIGSFSPVLGRFSPKISRFRDPIFPCHGKLFSTRFFFAVFLKP